MADLINRQAAINALCNDYCGGHQDCKLDEWRDLCDILLDELPYLKEIMAKTFLITT